MLNWLPEPPDFPADLRAALAVPQPEERVERLVALAQYRLGFLETIQLERALVQIPAEQTAGLSTARLAVLSSATVDHLKPAIRIAGFRRRLLFEIHLGAYGQYRQELLQPSPALKEFRPDFILLSPSARQLLASVPLAATSAEADARIGGFVEELRALWRKARETLGASVIQQTFLDIADPLFGSYDRLVPGAPSQVISRLNALTAEAASADGILILDVARVSERAGLETWFDTNRWLQAKLEIAPAAAAVYGELVARVIAAQRGLSRKCLVLDLDNTLWGGVIGDDGMEGITLGEGSAAGEAHLALQRYAKLLGERGIILAVCSKNDPMTAEGVFRDHPEMVLKRSDIAAFVANWEDKAANLRRVAEQLNIGLDSLVFVDDNPAERARIRQSLPMVAVPELPADAGGYVQCLADASYFEAVSFTADDLRRGEQYTANASREALLGASESLADFLRGLEMSVFSGPFSAPDLPRVVQLINKTNQFNPTTRRYTAEEIATIAAASEAVTLQFRLLDRFGDNGLVSVLILRPDREQADVMEIDTWVMSCRVFGRELEFEAMNIAVETARRRGMRAFRATYVPTKKNGVIRDLFPNLGFTRSDGGGAATDAIQWRLSLSEYISRKTYIERAGK